MELLGIPVRLAELLGVAVGDATAETLGNSVGGGVEAAVSDDEELGAGCCGNQ